MRISDWSSDVCSSDLPDPLRHRRYRTGGWLSRPHPTLLSSSPRNCRPSPPAPLPHPGGDARKGRFQHRSSHARPPDGKRHEWSHCPPPPRRARRSDEHTSELQSLMRLSYAVFCLKKKIKDHIQNYKNL